jgi:5-methyltetrahydrofolate--homocysteine methyltransferase
MKFDDWLKDESKVILFDGGMGTEIFKRGIEPGKLPDLLNIENSNIISDIHKSYYDAGSDMVQTNTFGSTLTNLKKYSADLKITEICTNAIANIQKVCPPHALIVGDIGPSGEFRPPVGNASPDEWLDGFKAQVKIMKDGVDLWHLETISDILEMQTAIQAVRELSNKPIIASLTYKKTRRGYYTIMGDSLQKCVETLDGEKIEVIGSNCTLISGEMIDIVKETQKHTSKPISVKPNAGQPEVNDQGITYYKQSVAEFVRDIGVMIQDGAKIVGGCCGTSPETIEAIRKLINSL